MPRVIVDETKGQEISVTIRFSDTPLEQAFKKALTDSFQDEIQNARASNGHHDACVDCHVQVDGSITLTGLAKDLNSRLHSPPMILPDSIKNNEGLQTQFWKEVGDVIYEHGRIQHYRDRDAEMEAKEIPLLRSEAHQKLFEEISATKEKLDYANAVNEFITALQENAVQAIGGRLVNLNSGQMLEESQIPGLEKHKDFAGIKERFQGLANLANEQIISAPDKNNDFF